MKNLIALILVALGIYGGYSLWQSRQSRPATPEVPAPAEVPAPKVPPPVAKVEPPAPAPSAPKVPTQPPAPARRLAPEGVFFLLQPVSITREEGITRVREGTQVKLLKETGETVHVTDGRIEFDVQRRQLTNDLDVVAQLRGQQVAQQAALAGLRANQRQAGVTQDVRKNVAAAETVDAGQRNLRLQQLRNRSDALAREDAALKTKIDDSYLSEYRESEMKKKGRIVVKSSLVSERPGMEARRQAISLEQARISDEMSRIAR